MNSATKDAATTANTTQVTFNTNATVMNTAALDRLSAIMQNSGAASTGGGLLSTVLGAGLSALGGLHLGGSDILPDILPHGSPGSPPAIPPRALGGPVSAGELYRVNENGMEFFRPNVSGQVIPMGTQQRSAFDREALRGGGRTDTPYPGIVRHVHSGHVELRAPGGSANWSDNVRASLSQRDMRETLLKFLGLPSHPYNYMSQ